MKVIYKRVINMIDGSVANFTVGKEYIWHDKTSECGSHIENDQGAMHYMSMGFMFEHFDSVKVVKPVTIDVAHRLVAFDMEIGCLQAELDNLRELIAKRMEEYQELKDEYGVEE